MAVEEFADHLDVAGDIEMPVRRTCVAFDPGDGGRDLAPVEPVPADRARRAAVIDARIVIDDLRAIVVELEPVAAADRKSVVEGQECGSTCRSRWSPYH